VRAITAIKRYLTPLGLLVVMALSLSGCIHLDRSVTLNGDGSGSYMLTLGINDQLLSAGGDQTAQTMNDYGAKIKAKGGSYKEYDLEGYTYWAYTLPFKNVSQLNQLLTQLPTTDASNGATPTPTTHTGDTFTVSEQSGFLSNTFHVTGHISLKAPQGSSGSSGPSDPQVQQLLKDMRDAFTLTMPGSITAHTGGSVNGNTITYAVHYGEETNIDVTGGGPDMSLIAPIAAGGAGVLLVILALVAYLIWRSRAKQPAAPVAQVAYGAPASYGAMAGQPVSPIWASSPEAPTTPDLPPAPDAPTQPE
jgi:hypothetical protein